MFPSFLRRPTLLKRRDITAFSQRCLYGRFSWLVILLGAVLYNEWLCYRLCYSMFWPRNDFLRTGTPEEKVITILLVSDPQLQGFRDEHPLFGYITRWDADRYLANGYSYALAFAQPDIVVFLGDLTDEGSRASTEGEYKRYVNRFRQIFLTPTSQEKVLLPGDNDVGGEGADLRSVDKVLRFEKHFSRTYQLVSKKFVDFFALDYSHTDLFTSARLERAKSQLSVMQRNRLKPFSVILNHENILPSTASFFNPVFEATRPNLLITGHSHSAFAMRCLRCWDPSAGILEHVRRSDSHFTELQFTLSTADVDGVLEIGVPTCSYRMGVPNMAYGLLTFNNDGAALYRNLWLPSRFRCLTLYGVAVAAALGSFLLHRRRHRGRSQWLP